MKKLLSLVLAAVMIASALTVCASSVSPSDVWTESANEKLIAPAEDETLELWFDHVSKKQEQSALTSTGLFTYTMTMAKNEIEEDDFYEEYEEPEEYEDEYEDEEEEPEDPEDSGD